MITKSLILTFLLAATLQAQNKIGYAQHGYPDVIKCGDYFYYLQRSDPNFSRYNVFTGTSDIVESYDVIKGVLSNKVGKLPGNCENETLDSLWAKKRAFRIFNLDRAPNRSIENENQTPDVIQCEAGILMYFLSKGTNTKEYRNPTGPVISYSKWNNSLDSLWGIGCGKTSLNTLIANKQTYNIATQLVSSSNLANSMVGNYPDLLKCDESTLFLTEISADKQWATYRGPTPRQGITEIKFQNGRYKSAQRRSLLSDCTYTSMDKLIGQGKAFNINTPVLKCPSDITSDTAEVEFQATQTGNLSLSYSHKSNSTFPVGQTTKVQVTASDKDSKISDLKCDFDVQVLDKQPPSFTCPANIKSKNRVVSFAAKATDNVSSEVRVHYSQEPGSKFKVGTSIITATATDEAGNKAECTFEIEIEDQKPPKIKCPEDITQKESHVNFQAMVTDNGASNLEIGYSQAPGSEFPIGKTVVIVTATDGSGNQATCKFNVTILDKHPPKVHCPQNITQKDPVVDFQAQATDNVTKNVKITYSHAPGSKFPLGETIVTVTGTDDAGNIDKCTFDINIDTVAPKIQCPENISSKERVVNFGATVTDNGAASLEIVYSHAPGSKFPIGKSQVKVNAIDGSGNKGQCSFDVTVQDSEAPVVQCPTNITSKNSVVNFSASAVDNSHQDVIVAYTQKSGSEFKVGKTKVTVTATDISGNKSQCSFDVNIEDSDSD